MTAAGVGSWIDERTPRVPDSFRRWLPRGDREPAEPSTLAALAARELATAAARPGRDREAAFLLLAGDALATYACESAADADDPGAALADVLRIVGDVGE